MRSRTGFFTGMLGMCIAMAFLGCRKDTHSQSKPANTNTLSFAPVAMQGDWFVASRPMPTIPGVPDQMVPPITVRITSNTYLMRYHKEGAFTGMYDAKGNAFPSVVDPNGKEYVENTFAISVNTNTTPWEVDLCQKDSSGNVAVQKGICAVRGEELVLSLGNNNRANRSTVFSEPQSVDGYSVTKATRVTTGERVH